MKKMFIHFTILICFSLLPYFTAAQQEPTRTPVPNSKYTLFNPTPKALMRDMDTDPIVQTSQKRLPLLMQDIYRLKLI